jgi:hypothetical protein
MVRMYSARVIRNFIKIGQFKGEKYTDTGIKMVKKSQVAEELQKRYRERA